MPHSPLARSLPPPPRRPTLHAPSRLRPPRRPSYFAYVPSAPINLLDARSAASSCVPYPASLARKQGQVVGISTDGARGEATLASGEKLPFDYALLSVGSTYPSAIKPAASVHDRAARLAELAAVTAQLEAAASVVVVGGGTVGVEVAAEVAEKHPSKKVWAGCVVGLLMGAGPSVQTMPNSASNEP